jgi:hypothetical protein
MNLFFIHHPANNPEGAADKHILVPLQNQEHDLSEGSEFLNDAIRIEDLSELYEKKISQTENHKP